MNNYILVGYMGCGKTTIGQALSKALDINFTDTDAMIVESQKMTINEIFDKYGESHFRDIETKTLEEMCENTNNTVVSCGGGLPLREENRKLLKKLGKVIYLSVKPDTVYDRLKDDDTRPLLRGDANTVKDKINSMLEFRGPIYESCADVVVETDNLSIEEIIDIIK